MIDAIDVLTTHPQDGQAPVGAEQYSFFGGFDEDDDQALDGGLEVPPPRFAPHVGMIRASSKRARYCRHCSFIHS